MKIEGLKTLGQTKKSFRSSFFMCSFLTGLQPDPNIRQRACDRLRIRRLRRAPGGDGGFRRHGLQDSRIEELMKSAPVVE